MKDFFIEITTGSVGLSVDQIWPDGDAPENPTSEDVREAMRQTGSLSTVLTEWALDFDLEAFVTERVRYK